MKQLKNNLDKIIKNTWLIFFIFISTLSFVTYIFCVLFVKKNPHLINENWVYYIDRIGFDFSQIISNLLQGKDPINNYYGVDFYLSRMPFLPYFLFFTYSFISKNFIIIHLIKNILFGTLIFLTVYNFNKKFNNYFLVLSLILLFYIPHNLWITLSTNYEEGWLNYLIPILFFLLITEKKYKSIYIGIVISVIFFLKASMYYLALVIPILYIVIEKKKSKYLPLIFFIISSISWGTYSYVKTGHFAYGFKSETLSTRTLAAAYTDGFFKDLYPKFSSDEMNKAVSKIVDEQSFTSEWEINEFLFDYSIKSVQNNPENIFIGLLKKANLILFYPFKDGQNYRSFKGVKKSEIPNQIRYSNFPNKIIFILSLLILFNSLFLKKNKNLIMKKVNIYYISIVVTYFLPYMIAFPFGRHCTSIYMISNIYLFLYLIEKYKFKFLKKKNNV